MNMKVKRIIALTLAIVLFLGCMHDLGDTMFSSAQEKNVKQAEDNNVSIKIKDTDITFTINKQLTYNGNIQQVVSVSDNAYSDYKVEYFPEKKDVAGEYSETSVNNITDAGKYKVQITLTNASAVFEADGLEQNNFSTEILVNKMDLKDCNITLDKTEYEYNGKEQKPSVMVTYGDNKSVPDADYDITYDSENFIDVNEAINITITAKTESNNFKGNNNVVYKIVSKDISDDAKVNVSPVNDSKWQFPEVSVEYENKVIAKENNYDIKWLFGKNEVTEISDIGIYTVLISFKGNYTGEITGSFEVMEDGSIETSAFKVENAVEKNPEDISKQEYYYKDAKNVSVKTSEGYIIKNASIGKISNDKKSLNFDENTDLTAGGVTITIVKVNEGVNTGKKFKLVFEKDSDAPVIIIKDSNNDYGDHYYDEKNSKTWTNLDCKISIDANDNDAAGLDKIYVSEDENEETWNVEYNTDYILSEGKTYYFKAVDKLGNASEPQKVMIPEIDKEAPEVEIRSGDDLVAGDIYLKADSLNDGKKELVLSISDTGSDVDSDSILCDGAELDKTKIIFTPTNIDEPECVKVTISVKDNVLNEKKNSFNIWYDPIIPVISNASIEGIEESETAILTTEDVVVKAEITDNDIESEGQRINQLVSVKIIPVTENDALIRDSEFVIDMQKDEGESTNIYTGTIITEQFIHNKYKIVAVDKAGNEIIGEDTFDVEIHKQAPEYEISAFEETSVDNPIAIDEINAKEGTYKVHDWINKDAVININVQIPKGSVEPVFEYQKVAEAEEKSALWQKLEYDSYSASDGNYKYKIKQDDDCFNGTYYFRVSYKGLESLNAEKSLYFIKDKKPVDINNIYVEYVKDNSQASGEKGIFSQIMDGVKRLFAKEKVLANIYVRDDISGAVSLKYSYGTANTEPSVTTGSETVLAKATDSGYETYGINGIKGSADYEDFHMFEIELSGDNADNLVINEIADEAGNVIEYKEGKPTELKSGTYIVIDKTSPVVSMEYPTPARTEEKTDTTIARKYYGNADNSKVYEEVKFKYTEKYFEESIKEDESVIYPEIKATISEYDKDTETVMVSDKEDEQKAKPYVKWDKYNSDTGEITGTVYLPYSRDEKGNEIEYVLETSYKDGSGNIVVPADEEVGKNLEGENGKYKTSYTMVLDNKAPEITYSIAGDTDRKVSGVPVYKNVESNDVALTVSVDENENYWNPEEMEIVIHNNNTGNNSLNVKGNDEETLNWEHNQNSRVYTVTIPFDGDPEDPDPATYNVTVKYADKAGNMMIISDNNGKDNGTTDNGTYTSPGFILDHKVPVFDISYNKVARLTSDLSNKAPEDDKTGVYPETGYTSYYGKEQGMICVTINITEDYAIYSKEKGLSESETDFRIVINKDGTDLSTDKMPKIEWTNTGNKYTAEFNIDSDGDYQIKVEYTDPAGNKMVPVEKYTNNNENAAGLTDGKYTSSNLILDTAEPDVSIRFVDSDGKEIKPVNSDKTDTTFYNQKGMYLELTVVDKNIRMNEIIQYIDRVMKITDINGSDIKGVSEAKKEIEIIEREKAVNSKEKLKVCIPYTDEAYYILANEDGFTDLANNAVEIKEDGKTGYEICKNVCVDYTKPINDILVSYKVDGGGFVKDKEKSNFITEIIEKIKRIFAKEKIHVTLYLRDDVSGVESVNYEYENKSYTVTTDDSKNDRMFEIINNITYTIKEFDIPFDVENVNKEFADNITITGLKDFAENSLTDDIEDIAISGDKLIVDNVSPTVSMEYPTPARTEEKTDTTIARKYYGNADNSKVYEEVKFKYTEKYFEESIKEDESVIYPEIKATISEYDKDTETVMVSDKEDEQKAKPYVKWDKYNSDTGEITGTVYLPYSRDEKGNEIEYVLETSYKDGSGNIVVPADEEVGKNLEGENGKYKTSYTMVLDNKAPEITYSIAGDTDRKVSGVPVYKNVESNDVALTVSVDENENYWNPEEMEIVIHNNNTGNNSLNVKGNDEETLNWEHNQNSRVYTVTIPFDGDPEDPDPATYNVTVKYADKAGNMMIISDNNGKDNGTTDNGTYTSPGFILDHKVPVFDISYNKVARLTSDLSNKAPEDDKTGVYPETGYTSYYGKEQGMICVTINITEDYAIYSKEKGLSESETDFRIVINKDGTDLSTDKMPKIEWTNTGNKYTAEFNIDSDGDYQIKVEYTDPAGNKMVPVEKYTNNNENVAGLTDGKYTSSNLILDTVEPKIDVKYVSINNTDKVVEPVNATQNIKYYNENVYLKLTVADKNVRNNEIINGNNRIGSFEVYKVEDKSKEAKDKLKEDSNLYNDISKKEINKLHREKFEWNLPLTTEANYTIPISVTDLAGNVTTIDTQKVTVDTSSPADIKFSYSVKNKGDYKKEINYKKDGYAFADNELSVKASAKDLVAGIKKITFIVTDENGKETIIEKPVADTLSSADRSITIPLETSEFKGDVKVTVTDMSENKSSKTQGQIVETADKHKASSTATITTHTKPSRTVKGVDYYNKDVHFTLTLKDIYSGIASYKYIAGSDIDVSRNYEEEAGNNLDKEQTRSIEHEYVKELTLDASKNNVNNVKVDASFIDNAGHTSSVKQKYNIDITRPTIEVSYDENNPANETYYKTSRIATVVITERNFDKNDVKFSITSTDGVMPSISGWTTSGTGDETKHTATVAFTEDSDYTFTLEFQDMAGNKAKYDTVDEFTIDKTIPEYSVTYDNNMSKNSYYYDKTRTATIEIDEHNFNADGVTVEVLKDGESIGNAGMSAWSKNGDVNIATIDYYDDADYTFTISGVDLAENSMNDYGTDHFVIDTTKPEVAITEIENMSANQGVVMPEVIVNDINYDHYEIVLDRCLEGRVTNVARTVMSSSGTGVHVKLNDIEHIPENDDIYTLSAIVYDKAGNPNETQKIYSVNRFGSNYTYNDSTNALVGKNGAYYTKQEQDIVIIETNADILEEKEVTVNYNGKLTALAEDEDYTIAASESDVAWKQYVYTIGKQNFVQEGTYSVILSSKDRANNTSDNNSKEHSIEFVVDKTNPTIQIGGVEDGAQYRADTRDITIAANDNISLKSVGIYIDEKEDMTLDAKMLSEQNGRIPYTLKSKNSKQQLSVTAVDAAGNEYTIETISFLLTTNIWIQFISNKPLFFGTIAGLIVVLGGVFYIIFIKKKRKKEE